MKKLALITGSGRGVGKSLAKLLLTKNYFVIGYSRSNKINHENFKFIKTDLSNLSLTKKIVFPNQNQGTVLLVNNAADIGTIMPFNKKSQEDILTEYQLNLITPTILTHKFINTYSKNKKILLNISSGAAKNPIGSWSTYCTAKAGLDMITQVISKEKHRKLNAYSIHPGIIDTDMQKKIRTANPVLFPLLNKFTDYYTNQELKKTKDVAKKIYYIIENHNKFKKKIISIRDVNIK